MSFNFRNNVEKNEGSECPEETHEAIHFFPDKCEKVSPGRAGIQNRERGGIQGVWQKVGYSDYRGEGKIL